MSNYSGKCDCFDVLVDIREVKDFSKVNIYAQGHFLVPLKIESKKDLAPYFPYIIAVDVGLKEGVRSIHLGNRSYVDTAEEERLGWILRDLVRYWKRCKRNKKEFDRSEAEKIVAYSHIDSLLPYEIELINRVEKIGDKATCEDIHIPLYDSMRKDLYEDMVQLGWDKRRAYAWCFGWKRAFKKWEELGKEDADSNDEKAKEEVNNI